MFYYDNAPEARHIYAVNSLLRKYRINFYYSLRKDVIFIFEGRSVKSILYPAYFLSAIGSVCFLVMFFFYGDFQNDPLMMKMIFGSGLIFLMAGVYILLDFYRKLKYRKTKIMISRQGISFRKENSFELLKTGQIKHMVPVFTLKKKKAIKSTEKKKLTINEGKLVVFNHLGQKRDLLCITNYDKQELKDDLESVMDVLSRFMKVPSNHETLEFVSEEKAVYHSAASNPR